MLPDPIQARIIFRGNASYPYNKGAMLAPLPGGYGLAAACQAGQKEASPDQRILFTISPDGGTSWAEPWVTLLKRMMSMQSKRHILKHIPFCLRGSLLENW